MISTTISFEMSDVSCITFIVSCFYEIHQYIYTVVEEVTLSLFLMYTILQVKNINVRVNIKTDMIKDLVNDLHNRIKQASETHTFYKAPQTIVLTIDDKNTDFYAPVNDFDTPCLNIDCLWLKYLNYFFRNMENHWMLPAYADNGNCVICDTTPKFSSINITKKKRISIKPLV